MNKEVEKLKMVLKRLRLFSSHQERCQTTLSIKREVQ